jgi:hypothetical protein
MTRKRRGNFKKQRKIMAESTEPVPVHSITEKIHTENRCGKGNQERKKKKGNEEGVIERE